MFSSILSVLPWEAIVTAITAFLIDYFIGKSNRVEANSVIHLGENLIKTTIDKNKKI